MVVVGPTAPLMRLLPLEMSVAPPESDTSFDVSTEPKSATLAFEPLATTELSVLPSITESSMNVEMTLPVLVTQTPTLLLVISTVRK